MGKVWGDLCLGMGIDFFKSATDSGSYYRFRFLTVPYFGSKMPKNNNKVLYIFIIFPVGKQSADITCSYNRIFSIPVPVLVNSVMCTRYLKMFGSVLSVPNIRYPTLPVS